MRLTRKIGIVGCFLYLGAMWFFLCHHAGKCSISKGYSVFDAINEQQIIKLPTYLHLPYDTLVCNPGAPRKEPLTKSVEDLGVEKGELTIKFDGRIDDINAVDLIDVLLQHIDDLTIERVVLFFNTNGGDVDVGMKIAQLIQKYPAPIVCFVPDHAASMGFYILQSCSVREMSPTATLMTHEPSALIPQESLNRFELQARIDDLNIIADKMAIFISSRMGITEEDYLLKVKEDDWRMDSQEAMTFHAVDRIAYRFIPVKVTLPKPQSQNH